MGYSVEVGSDSWCHLYNPAHMRTIVEVLFLNNAYKKHIFLSPFAFVFIFQLELIELSFPAANLVQLPRAPHSIGSTLDSMLCHEILDDCWIPIFTLYSSFKLYSWSFLEPCPFHLYKSRNIVLKV